MKIVEFPDDVKLIEDFLTKAECEQLIALGEKIGYDEAAINTGQGQEIFKAIRNNERILFDDVELADKLFKKLFEFLPKKIDMWQLKGLNERFRFYKYVNGQYFKWHRDGAYQRSESEESKITFMVYLNAGYAGGDTEFRGFKVSPKEGAALIFSHPLMHQGAVIAEGTKYVLRTDVMYQKESKEK